jgi:quercetin dioxygenase-like cupin family protein
MQEHGGPRERPSGQTSGTEQRDARVVNARVTVFNLLNEAEALRREPAWQQGDRNAKTFVKEGDLRVVLTVIKQGAVVKEHQAPGTAVVQTLSGHIALRVEGQAVELPAGEMVILEANLPHDVEAVEESAFTITIAWKAVGGARSTQ